MYDLEVHNFINSYAMIKNNILDFKQCFESISLSVNTLEQ